MQQTQQSNIRVLVGDTSVRSRLVLSGMIDAEPGLEVIDTARTKEELVHKALTSCPDMIVAGSSLSVNAQLPFFQTVYQIGDCTLLMALNQGSIFPVYNPVKKIKTRIYSTSSNQEGAKEELLGKMREYAKGKRSERQKSTLLRESTIGYNSFNLLAQNTELPLTVVVVGASTGGSKAIEELVKRLDMKEPAVILVALHMPENFSERLARRLQQYTDWTVVEGYRGMILKPRTIVIAPGGKNMIVRSNPVLKGILSIDFVSSPVTLDTPSVDLLLESAAACAKERVLGVILSGMGTDGTAGAQKVYRQGGRIIAQNEASSTIFGMANSVIKSGVVSGVYALDQIHLSIRRFAVERSMGFMLESEVVG